MLAKIFNVDRKLAENLSPVTTTISKDFRGNFEPEGLFSTEIFGDMGSKDRMNQFAYIKLNTKVFSPYIYDRLLTLSSFHKEIISGVSYAEWDDVAKTFIPSNFNDGDTGYQFYISHFEKMDINFESTGSVQREQKINLMGKYKDGAIIERLLVLPAGMRDIVTKNGQDEESEINPIYRKIMGYAKLLENTNGYAKENDQIRLRLQNAIQEYFAHVFTIVSGKNGLIQGGWAKRSIESGTRNVLTAALIKSDVLGEGLTMNINNSLLNMFQLAHGMGHRLDYLLRKYLISDLINDTSQKIRLVNPKTNRFELYDKKNESEKLLTEDGLYSLILKKLENSNNSFNTVKVDGKYIALIYNDGKTIKLLTDNDDSLDKQFIRPISYMELIFIVSHIEADEFYGLMTRYPIASQGGIYPTIAIVKPTVEILKDVVISIGFKSIKIDNFPKFNSKTYTGMGIHHSKLKNLGADFDGDALSFTLLHSDDAKEELKKYFGMKSAYVKPTGELVDNVGSDISEHVLKTLTKGI